MRTLFAGDMTTVARSATIYAGIEGGGTKFVCAVGRSPTDILERVVIPTSDPHTTLAQCVRFFSAAEDRHGRIASIGFSCFGPIELRSGAAGFGRSGEGIPTQSPSHNMADPRYRNCTTCHVRIHGSNADPQFLR